MNGLGICYPIKDYWFHCFTALNFTHCTSTPLFQLDGKVYVRRPKGVHIFAWGKSGPSSSTSPKYSIHQRSEKWIVLCSKSGEVNQISGACNGEVFEASKGEVEGGSSNGEVQGGITKSSKVTNFNN